LASYNFHSLAEARSFLNALRAGNRKGLVKLNTTKVCVAMSAITVITAAPYFVRALTALHDIPSLLRANANVFL